MQGEKYEDACFQVGVLDCPEIYKPIMPYFSSTYMTFLGVLQGLVLAVMFGDSIIEVYAFPLRAIITILTVALIWHKYINHHQFLGWQITWHDTCILIIIGIVQVWQIKIMNCPELFYATTGAILLFGGLAYYYAGYQHNKDYIRRLFVRHYCGRGECGAFIHEIILTHERKSTVYCFVSGLLGLIVAYLMPLGCGFFEKVYFALLLMCLLYFWLYYDLGRILKSNRVPCVRYQKEVFPDISKKDIYEK